MVAVVVAMMGDGLSTEEEEIQSIAEAPTSISLSKATNTKNTNKNLNSPASAFWCKRMRRGRMIIVIHWLVHLFQLMWHPLLLLLRGPHSRSSISSYPPPLVPQSDYGNYYHTTISSLYLFSWTETVSRIQKFKTRLIRWAELISMWVDGFKFYFHTDRQCFLNNPRSSTSCTSARV